MIKSDEENSEFSFTKISNFDVNTLDWRNETNNFSVEKKFPKNKKYSDLEIDPKIGYINNFDFDYNPGLDETFSELKKIPKKNYIRSELSSYSESLLGDRRKDHLTLEATEKSKENKNFSSKKTIPIVEETDEINEIDENDENHEKFRFNNFEDEEEKKAKALINQLGARSNTFFEDLHKDPVKGQLKLKQLYKKGKLKKTEDIHEFINGRSVFKKATQIFKSMHFRTRQKRNTLTQKNKILEAKQKLKLKKIEHDDDEEEIKLNSKKLEKDKSQKRGKRMKTMKLIEQKTFVEDQKLEKPDHQKLERFLKNNYITDKRNSLHSFSSAFTNNDTPPILSCFKENKTAYDSLGPGVILYFNFLKSAILFFVICSVITLPIQWTNIRLYNESKNPSLKPYGDGLSSKLYGLLTSTTLGVNLFSKIF